MLSGTDRRPRGAARDGARLRRRRRSSRTPRSGTAPTSSRSTRCARWASSACSASRSPSRSAAVAATSPGCAWRSRSWPASTSRWRSRSRPVSGSGPTRSTSSARPNSRQRWLPDLCAGRALGGFGLTEPDAGTDAGGTRTRAELDESTREWVINGEKAFITNSGTPITSVVTVTALHRAERDLDDHRAGGYARASRCSRRTARWAGTRPTPTGSRSSSAACPRSNLLGERGRGFAQFLEILDEGRVAIAALAVGVIQRCVDDSRRLRRRATRRSAGRSARTRRWRSSAPTCRWRWPRPATSCTTRRGCAITASRSRTRRPIAKLFATEAAIDATRSATQVFGGYGFMDETPVSRHVPRRQDPRDRRGHERGAAPDHRPVAGPAGLTRRSERLQRRVCKENLQRIACKESFAVVSLPS